MSLRPAPARDAAALRRRLAAAALLRRPPPLPRRRPPPARPARRAWRGAPARRWSPPTTCATTIPSAAAADVLTCIREAPPSTDAGLCRLSANAERHLKPAAEMARLFADARGAVAAHAARRSSRLPLLARRAALRISRRDRSTPARRRSRPWRRAGRGAPRRYPDGVPPDKVATLLEHELALIARLRLRALFPHRPRHRRASPSEQRHPLPGPRLGGQLRGLLLPRHHRGRSRPASTSCSSASSRAERNEPPDIDVDFEHERREEVIQYIYRRYGRDRAAIAATVIRYRAALGDPRGRQGAGPVGGRDRPRWPASSGAPAATASPRAHAARGRARPGRPASCAGAARWPQRADRLPAPPVAACRRLRASPAAASTRLVPIENAAWPDRTFIEWDKDDIDALGILKVDVLALGMLTCIRKRLRPDRAALRHRRSTLATVPPEDPAVYDMLRRADSLGVFQVESRAQMTMLPRLKPRELLRPRHRGGDRPPRPDPGRHGAPLSAPAQRRGAGRPIPRDGAREPVLQQDAGRAAVPGAGDADRHRRRRLHPGRGRRAAPRHGDLPPRRHHLAVPREVHRRHGGATAIERTSPSRCFNQIEGFGAYGFPESHAASFALLVYVSAWIKCHHPDVFACALLNSQPMGFYAPAQIVRDAREHGVRGPAPPTSTGQRLGLHAGTRSGQRGGLAAPARPAPGAGLPRGGGDAHRRGPPGALARRA